MLPRYFFRFSILFESKKLFPDFHLDIRDDELKFCGSFYCFYLDNECIKVVLKMESVQYVAGLEV